MTIMMLVRLGSRKAMTERIRKNEGKQSMMSTPRMIPSSTRPPKYPLIRPSPVPMLTEMPTATKPTHREIRPP